MYKSRQSFRVANVRPFKLVSYRSCSKGLGGNAHLNLCLWTPRVWNVRASVKRLCVFSFIASSTVWSFRSRTTTIRHCCRRLAVPSMKRHTATPGFEPKSSHICLTSVSKDVIAVPLRGHDIKRTSIWSSISVYNRWATTQIYFMYLYYLQVLSIADVDLAVVLLCFSEQQTPSLPKLRGGFISPRLLFVVLM